MVLKRGNDKLADKKRIALELEHIADTEFSTIDDILSAAKFAKRNKLIRYVVRMKSWLAWSAFDGRGWNE